jgi:hypothetical protein
MHANWAGSRKGNPESLEKAMAKTTWIKKQLGMSIYGGGSWVLHLVSE